MNARENRPAFDKAADEYFTLVAQSPDDLRAAAQARAHMWLNGPNRVRALFIEGARRDGLMPIKTTKPPAGVSAWDWCDSADEFRARLLACTHIGEAEELYLLLQDADRIAGVATEPIERCAPLLAVQFAAAKAVGGVVLDAAMKKGGAQ